MRITYIHQHFKMPSEDGGGRPYEFASRLARDGHEVTLICGGDHAEQVVVQPGLKVMRIASPYANHMTFAARINSFLSFMMRATWVAIRTPSDRVFASSTPLTVVIPGVIGARIHRVPFILEIRDLWPSLPIELGALPPVLHAPACALESFGYRSASAVIALSPGMAEGVRRVNRRVPISVIPNSVDRELFHRPGGQKGERESFGVFDDQPVLYYAGGLGPSHDPLWLADLAVALCGRAHVRVAGDGSMRDEAMARCQEAGLDPKQVFLGPISRQQVANLAAASEAALSSLMDSPGLLHSSLNKVFDAIAAQKAVVFNHGGWLCASLLQEGAGYLAPRVFGESDVEALVEWLYGIRQTDAGKGIEVLAELFDRDVLFDSFSGVLTGCDSSEQCERSVSVEAERL